MIVARGIHFHYTAAAAGSVPALRGVDFQVRQGESVALVGATGSGKTTLALHLNGLLRPVRGTIEIDGVDIWAKRSRRERAAVLREAHRSVGLVFQYPEQQLFEETVGSDVAFGPRNLGLTESETVGRTRWALAMVGLDEGLAERSPFDLSGGERRRVALAGTLAMRPRYLVLDEPTAALDPCGRADLIALLASLRDSGMGLVVVTHDMEEAAELCDRVVALHGGLAVAEGTPREVFGMGADRLASWGLAAPAVTRVLSELRRRGLGVGSQAMTVEEARDAITRALGLG